jgi:acetyltransferase-like isoleucine patch superfamily enzyme
MSILFVGADYDLILEIRGSFSSKEIIGYTSNIDHFYKEIPYFGSLRDKSELDPQTKLIIATSDIVFRKFVVSQWSENITEYVSDKAIFIGKIKVQMGTTISMNSFVSGGCTIGMMSSIGAFCRLHHGSIVGDYCVISPGSTLLGDSEVASECFVGANATILPRVKVSNNCIIGAGSVVVEDTQPFGVYAGNPAKLIRLIC